MGIHTVDAIVLRQYPYRETSVLVNCFTDRVGKLKGLIKGLRGPGPSRYRSAMEPLTLNRIVFYDSRTSDLHLISQCDLLCAFPGLSQQLDVMRIGASCAELVEVLTESHEPQPAIFALLHATLERLSDGAAHPAGLRVHFVLRLLRLVGFQPQLDECAGCGQRSPGRGFWSARQGGLLCERCLHEDPQAHALAADWIQELSACAEAEDPPALEASRTQAFLQRLDEFLHWRLDRPLKTARLAP